MTQTPGTERTSIDDRVASPRGLSQPKELVSPFALLLLAQSPDHGYALAERLKAFGFDWGGPGPLYNHLRVLETRGLVRSSMAPGDSGPVRRTYGLTPMGRVALAAYARTVSDLRETLDRLLRTSGQRNGRAT